MISSASTLFLAALVMSTSVFAAPIRLLPVVPSEVAVHAESTPQLAARAATVVDVQPIYRRSPGTFSRRSARLLTEREPETLEVPVARALVEEPEVRRRYPRRVYEEYYEKREPQPEPVDIPAPVVQKRAEEERPRAYPRRVYAEYYEKREPQPEPVDVPAPVVQKREEERPRAYPRRVYYEHFEKRAPNPEPAIKVKETTVTVTKVSTFDTPEDLAAAISNKLISGGSVGTTESTLISMSQTQTIPPPSIATATGAPIVVSATGTAATASAATATGAVTVATVTGSTTATSTATVVTVTGSATSTVAQPLVTATATPSAVVSATSSSAGTTTTNTGSSTTPGGGSQPPAVNLDQPSGGTLSFVKVRDVKGATTEPIQRRAYSGATWASFVKRQSN